MIKIMLSRSSALYESGEAPQSAPEEVEMGPFEFVQLSYNYLRVGPEADFIGAMRNERWYVQEDPIPFSDIVIEESLL